MVWPDSCFNLLPLFRIDQEVKSWHFLAPEIAGFASLFNVELSKPNKEENSLKQGKASIIRTLLWS
jgi:hypothetical protein